MTASGALTAPLFGYDETTFQRGQWAATNGPSEQRP